MLAGSLLLTLSALGADASEAVNGSTTQWWLSIVLLALCAALAMRCLRLGTAARRVTRAFLEHLRPSGLSAAEDRRELDGMGCYVQALSATRADLERERAARADADAGLQELEERYGMALRGADDAIWEWDLRTDRAYFSAHWKSMLGYPDDEIAERIDEWWERVHPEDHERLLQALKAHLEGHSPRLDIEHRVRHRDGSWRWLHARGSLVRNVAGEPSRTVGLASDVTARRRIQDAVAELAEGLSQPLRDEALSHLVRTFAAVVGVRECFVCECRDSPTTRVRMLARWKGGELARCVEFDLNGTACEEVIRDGRTVFQPRDADERWPLEGQFDRRSYLGIACFDSTGRVIGHIACADDKPMRDELPPVALLKIFAMRAAVQIERNCLEKCLSTGGSAVLTRESGVAKREPAG